MVAGDAAIVGLLHDVVELEVTGAVGLEILVSFFLVVVRLSSYFAMSLLQFPLTTGSVVTSSWATEL